MVLYAIRQKAPAPLAFGVGICMCPYVIPGALASGLAAFALFVLFLIVRKRLD
jgi:hypothetical protein